MNKSMWNNEAVKAYESGQGVVLVEKPYPHYEPVAWHYPGGKPDQCTTNKEYAEKDPAWTPMYYKHEWVGLTEEEYPDVRYQRETYYAGIKWAEDKLKEKNT